MNDRDILAGKRILIVDDEPDILETLRELLDMSIVDSAPNFETAQKFLKKNSYDAAILDIMGVRGYDLLALCRDKDIPALMLTAHALNPDDLVRSIRKGAKAYIPKDKISEVSDHLGDIVKAHKEGEERYAEWYAKLKPYFDKKFGPGWKKKHEQFWKEFEETYGKPVSRKEAEEIL